MAPFCAHLLHFLRSFLPQLPHSPHANLPSFRSQTKRNCSYSSKTPICARVPSSEFTLNLRRTKLFTSICAHVPAGWFFIPLSFPSSEEQGNGWCDWCSRKACGILLPHSMGSTVHLNFVLVWLADISKHQSLGWEWCNLKIETINTYVELHWSKVWDWLSNAF